jgi:chromosome segregation ATPase
MEDLQKLISACSDLENKKIELEFKVHQLETELQRRDKLIHSMRQKIDVLSDQKVSFFAEIKNAKENNQRLENDLQFTTNLTRKMEDVLQCAKERFELMKNETEAQKEQLNKDLMERQAKLQISGPCSCGLLEK